MRDVMVKMIICMAFAGIAVSIPARAQPAAPAQLRPQQMSDAALVQELAKGDQLPPQVIPSNRLEWVAEEIFLRGEHMIPLLMTLENNTHIYRGGGLTLAISNEVFLGEVTVEVVGIYLICAIYEGKMPFAMSPGLERTHPSTAPHDRTNSPGNVHRAWSSIHQWLPMLNTTGLAALRKQRVGPLVGSGVTF